MSNFSKDLEEGVREYTFIKRILFLYSLGIPVPKGYNSAIPKIKKCLTYSKKEDIVSAEKETYTLYSSGYEKLIYYTCPGVFNRVEIILDITFSEICSEIEKTYPEMNVRILHTLAKIILWKMGVDFYYFSIDRLHFRRMKSLLLLKYEPLKNVKY